jgi:LPPG:FO 2-phospho-L-lactate transferase
LAKKSSISPFPFAFQAEQRKREITTPTYRHFGRPVVGTNRFVCLAGGVGAAKFLQGLANVVPAEDVVVVVNTGDDIELHGLHLSPDLDIVMYTLAGIVEESKGWGIKHDTFQCLSMLQRYGCETWFNLGDKDLATHVYRTKLLKDGFNLSEVTTKLSQQLGLRETILPMTNDKFETRILTDNGEMHFQEFMVKYGMHGNVLGVRFKGGKQAKPCPEVLSAILHASGIIVCPSNPVVSIGTILSVRGIREALRETKAKVVSISPIIAGKAVKGPAAKLMLSRGLKVSAFSVADLYKDFVDVFILDTVDKNLKKRIEAIGLQTIVTDTLMKTGEDKVRLAKVALSCLDD